MDMDTDTGAISPVAVGATTSRGEGGGGAEEDVRGDLSAGVHVADNVRRTSYHHHHHHHHHHIDDSEYVVPVEYRPQVINITDEPDEGGVGGGRGDKPSPCISIIASA